MNAQVNIPAYVNRHSIRDRLGRCLWGWVWLVFCRHSFRHFHAWRIFFLRLFGAKIGRKCAVLPSVIIRAPWNLTMGDYSCLSDFVDCYSVDRITLGDRAVVSQGVFLCCASHDITSSIMELTYRPIVIQSQAWVAARAFVGPGVTIGEGAVVGACAVVTKDVEPWCVVVGNPARTIKRREIVVSEHAAEA